MAKKNYDVECGLLTKIVEIGEYSTILDNNINQNFFEGDNRRLFRFIQEFYQSHSEMPTLRVIETRFPHYQFEKYISNGNRILGTKEPVSFWVEEVRRKIKHNGIFHLIEEAAQLLKDESPQEALELLYSGALDIGKDTEENPPLLSTEHIEERIERYENRANKKGMLGIPTGFEILDEMMGGYAKGRLHTLIARTSTGKTWFLIMGAVAAVLNGYTPMIFTTEMSREEILDRFDATLFSILYTPMNYTSFLTGKLDAFTREKFEHYLKNDAGETDPLIIYDGSDVLEMAGCIDRHKPDIVFIDGIYLLEDVNKAEADWLRVSNIGRDVKYLLRRKKIPGVATTQADPTTTRRTGPELESMSFSKQLGMHSDAVISMWRDDQMREDQECMLRLLKQREGPLGKFMINFNFQELDFSCIYRIDDGGAVQTQEKTKTKAKAGGKKDKVNRGMYDNEED